MSKPNVPGKKSMSLKETVLALAAVAAMTVGLQARAEGHGPGNGGSAVAVDGKLYLLDLLEAGVQSHPVIHDSPDAGYDAALFRIRAERLVDEKTFGKDEAGIIRRQLSALPTLVRDEFLSVMNLYRWRIVDLPVERIYDVKSPLDLSNKEVYQLAYRRDGSILINRELWNRLDTANRAALVIHEVVYASLRPRKDRDGFFAQDSWDARQITRDLFSEGRPRDPRTYSRDGQTSIALFPATDAADPRIENPRLVFDVAHVDTDGARLNEMSIAFAPFLEVCGGDGKDCFSIIAGQHLEPYYRDLFCTTLASLKAAGRSPTVRHTYVIGTISLRDYESKAGSTQYASSEFRPVIASYPTVASTGEGGPIALDSPAACAFAVDQILGSTDAGRLEDVKLSPARY